MIIIAHRLSAVRQCDRIITVEAGEVTEQGSHEELLRADGRYAQLYSRIGFVHEFKPLTETEMRLLLATHAGDFGISFDPAQLDAIEAQAAVIRITRGNFRLMERLFAQMRRIMTLNRVEEVTADIVQAARDCLVIGPGN